MVLVAKTWKLHWKMFKLFVIISKMSFCSHMVQPHSSTYKVSFKSLFLKIFYRVNNIKSFQHWMYLFYASSTEESGWIKKKRWRRKSKVNSSIFLWMYCWLIVQWLNGSLGTLRSFLCARVSFLNDFFFVFLRQNNVRGCQNNSCAL